MNFAGQCVGRITPSLQFDPSPETPDVQRIMHEKRCAAMAC